MSRWLDDVSQRRRQHLPFWLLVAVLVSGSFYWWYSHQQTIQSTLAELSKSRMEQGLSQLHLMWLREQKRPQVEVDGQLWDFSPSGWPLGLTKREQGQQACADIWRLLLDEAPRVDGKMLLIEMSSAPTRCFYRNGNGFALVYNTVDGRVSLLQE